MGAAAGPSSRSAAPSLRYGPPGDRLLTGAEMASKAARESLAAEIDGGEG